MSGRMKLNRKWLQRGPTSRPGWKLQEARAASTPGGEPVGGSGCSQSLRKKSDVQFPQWREECKTTGAGSLTVEKGWLQKIRKEANDTDRRPILCLGFDGSPREDWRAFTFEDAEILMTMTSAVLRGDYREARELAEMLLR